MTVTNRRLVLASRPTGAPREDNFRLESAPVAELAEHPRARAEHARHRGLRQIRGERCDREEREG